MSEPTTTPDQGPPKEVVDEFNSSLDAYIKDWKEGIAKKAVEYEASQKKTPANKQ